MKRLALMTMMSLSIGYDTSLLHAQVNAPSIDVEVTVVEERVADGYLYRYRVQNKAAAGVASLLLGFNRITAEAELQEEARRVGSPQGWRGSQEGAEGLDGLVVVWELADRLDEARVIAPGAAMDGFEVLLSRPAPEYRKAVFTAHLRDSNYDVGNVKPAQPSSDQTPPTVSITGPVTGAVVSGTVAASAEATDDVGVLDVRFKLDDRNLQSTPGVEYPPLDASPYSALWNTLFVASGAHKLTAIARDAAGNVTVSAPVTVTVENDRSLPTITMTSPANGGTVQGTTKVEATVSAVQQVSLVVFQADGRNFAKTVAPPHEAMWDTSSVSDGNHILTAAVLDASGAVVRSDPVTITVRNRTDSTPPALRLSASPSSLWPPNHKLVPVAVGVTVTDDADPTPVIRLESISCDDHCIPAADIVGASIGSDDRQFEVRAERNGKGTGRTYTMTYSATDAAGNKSTATVAVIVPHDQRKGK